MFRRFKPYTIPAVTFLLGLGLQFAPIQNKMLGGILIGIAGFWLFGTLASDRALLRRFPWLAEWMPFLASMGAEGHVFASRQELEVQHIVRKTFRLVDLAGLAGVIHERTVQDCDIYGPAMIVLGGGSATVYECTFTNPKEAVFVVVSPEQQKATGLLSVTGHCVFRRCKLHDIAFLGTRQQIDQILDEGGVKPLPPSGPASLPNPRSSTPGQ